jgi:hypothetical protein
MTNTGELPAGVDAQARLVWQDLVEVLKKAIVPGLIRPAVLVEVEIIAAAT